MTLLLCLAGVLSGCATAAGYDQRVAAYVGAHADTILMQWGPPDKSATLSDGGHVFEYMRTSAYETGGYTYYTTEKVKTKGGDKVKVSVPNYVPPRTVFRHCMTRFIIGPDNKARSYVFSGDACRAREQGPLTWDAVGRMLVGGTIGLDDVDQQEPAPLASQPNGKMTIDWSNPPAPAGGATPTPQDRDPENPVDPAPSSVDRSR